MKATYICFWGEGYSAEEPCKAVTIDWFCDDMGYEPEMIDRIKALGVHDTLDLTDLSGVHTVTRVV
jgi:hypothetical protein